MMLLISEQTKNFLIETIREAMDNYNINKCEWKCSFCFNTSIESDEPVIHEKDCSGACALELLKMAEIAEVRIGMDTFKLVKVE